MQEKSNRAVLREIECHDAGGMDCSFGIVAHRLHAGRLGRFATRDDSRNTWWVAIISFGEGWHNNHHAHPTSARHGLAWYEFDPTWIQLKCLRAVGFVWDLRAARASQSPKEEIAA